jgi:hypothetical protein
MIDFSGDVFVGTGLTIHQLTSFVSEVLETQADAIGNIESSNLSLSVRENPDTSSPHFGQYGFMIEFESDDTSLDSTAMVQLKMLLESLWAKGMKTETACEFESELPHNGRFDGAENKPIVYDDSPPA